MRPRKFTRRNFLMTSAVGAGWAIGALGDDAHGLPAPAAAAPEPPGAALNVKSAPYDASGDGRTDDSPALQAAIDDCFNAGGGTVYLPAGVYLLGGASIYLRDGVNVNGAGAFVTTVKLADGANRPVITDGSAGKSGEYAFGRVRLADFAVDGNQAGNPKGQEGIFTTAYYSTFERLYIHDCRAHGLRMGSPEIGNQSSQNRIVGCRIADCGGTGVLVDINSVDHTISQNYIHSCDIGVQIGNGGVRVINNDIFGNATAAVQIEQTANNVIIAANDLNANARNGIIITRTTVLNGGPWSQVMIANNSIQGDALAADNSYDAIYVTTSVPKGIQEITIVGNKIYSPFAGKRFRYGVNLAENVVRAKCAANHILDTATASYHVGPGCSGVDIDRLGAGALKAPGVPRSGRALRNPFSAPVMVYVFGGKVKSIAVDNLPTGLTGGSLRLLPDQIITLAYTQAPRWTWFGG